MLPRVKIYFQNGVLGSTTPSEDGVGALLCNGVAVTDKLTLGTPYLISSMDDLDDLGITSESDDANKAIYKVVREYYSEAPEGSRLWLMVVADTVTMTQMCDVAGTHIKPLILAGGGDINFVMISRTPASGYTPTVLDGLDGDVFTAMAKAQEAAQWATESRYAPCIFLLEGRSYSGTATALKDLTEGEDNRVGVLIGDSISGSAGAAIGLLGGRIAAIPVQRSIARVKTGAINADALYIGSVIPQKGDPDVISDKGYITFRSFVGKAGYFFTDDRLATDISDDYALIPRRRVADKAYRLAYRTVVEEIGEEVPTSSDGTLPGHYVKALQRTVESALERSMTAEGNLGVDPSDPNDTGVSCFIDHTQNVVSSSVLKLNIGVKPHGYQKYIDVYLGFKTSNS